MQKESLNKQILDRCKWDINEETAKALRNEIMNIEETEEEKQKASEERQLIQELLKS